MKRIGECKRCGRCCTVRGLIVEVPLDYVKIALKLNITVEQAKVETAAMLDNMVCPNLTMEHDRAFCQIYGTRPEFCKLYPAEPADLVEGCGFSFVEGV